MRRLFITLVMTMIATLVCTPITNAIEISAKGDMIVFYDKNASGCAVNTAGGIAGAVNNPTPDLKAFVRQYVNFAVATNKKYGTPYEAVLAQGVLESGMGKSTLASKYNNFFGIKAGSGWTGQTVTMNTQEDSGGGSMYTIADAFRVFPTPQEGWNGYGEFITKNSRYAKALQYPGDPYKYIQEIKNAGYATDSAYVAKVSSIIKNIEEIVKTENLAPPSSQITVEKPVGGISTQNASYSGECDTAGSANPATVGKILEIARAELAKKPVAFDSTVMKYTTGRSEAWCADFVSWVYKEAGVPFTGGNNGWQIPAAGGMAAWFKQHGSFVTENPQPGDVVVFGLNGSYADHVSIVEKVSGSTITTIGGNESNTILNLPGIPAKAGMSSVNGVVSGFGRLKGVINT